MDSSGQTTTPWTEHYSLPTLPRLSSDLTVDTCVVGAGISGLSVAYQLARRGLSVVVLEAGVNVASGETGRTTAHLSSAIDNRLVEIERMHGENGARICAQSHRAAIDEIERTVRDAAISCDFERVDGFLFLGAGDPVSLLETEFAASHRAGLSDVELLESPQSAPFELGPVLRYPRQAQFHPLKYMSGLAEAVQALGVRVLGGAHVEDVEDGTPARARLRGGGVVTASSIVVATGTPINDRVAVHTKQSAWRSYVISVRIPRDSARHALYWDTAKPYRYTRVQAGPTESAYDLLIVGGEDHKTGHADDAEERWDRLVAWTRARYPLSTDVIHRWSGQVFEPADGVAFIGRNPGDDHVFVVTGDSGQGMTHGTIAGMLLADLVMGRDNVWSSLYDPGRVPLRALGAYTQDNLASVAAYSSWLTRGDVDDVSRIPVGTGALVRRGLEKIACYRDEQGTLHRRSATCPHLGAIVTWNAAENTWDCPAHGSRFDALGCVLNGPANSDLHVITEEPAESSKVAVDRGAP